MRAIVMPPHEPSTGGCDGPTASGPNENQGAESTLAPLSALQHAQRLDSAGDTTSLIPPTGR
ncbi:hypothetical protein Drose_36250 [Dactylosporangium roseum]|uniref:Uncharacterized protein n=1 Tax=Dactylosporangium roseum TaxID=47989 RepID=A0ABY5ZIT7_9ACTN|nr:hypothetical protein [Dactylosporangium roseum]UWZ40843.1 hypothetical protein Drose_36250 [Dactylosporangium roseum]